MWKETIQNVHRLILLFLTFFSLQMKRFWKNKIIARVLFRNLYFRPSWLTKIWASIFDNFLILILKHKVVSLKNWTKEGFSTSKYSPASIYPTGTWIFFFLFDFHFLPGHVVAIDFYAGFFGFHLHSVTSRISSLSTHVPFEVKSARVCIAYFYEELNYYNYPENRVAGHWIAVLLQKLPSHNAFAVSRCTSPVLIYSRSGYIITKKGIIFGDSLCLPPLFNPLTMRHS